MSQKALVLEEVGKPFVLSTRPIPEPKEGEILIKVFVAGLNPHDSYLRERGLFIKTLPTPTGIDIVGTVTKLGPGVTNFSVGDHVFTLGNPSNPDETATQEYAIGKAIHTAKVPQGFNDDQIATLTLNPLTSFFGLFTTQGFNWPSPLESDAEAKKARKEFDPAKKTLLVIGGGSACGKYAISWARILGIGRIITVASKGKSEDELKSLGATHVVDRHLSDEEIKKHVRAITGDDLVYAIDCVSKGNKQTLGASILSDSKKATLVVLVHAGSVDEQVAAQKKGGFERKAMFASPPLAPEISVKYWKAIKGLIEEGQLLPTQYAVIDGLDAKKLNEALDGYRDGKATIKPHIHVS